MVCSPMKMRGTQTHSVKCKGEEKEGNLPPLTWLYIHVDYYTGNAVD